MNQSIHLPTPHDDPWVNLAYGYISQAVESLTASGLQVREAWLDPKNPRDATIVLVHTRTPATALVWDEETGWRTGPFVSGRQGVRTTLSDTAYLGGGVLPSPGEVVRRLLEGHEGPRVQHRSHADLDDGLDARLASYAARGAQEAQVARVAEVAQAARGA